MTDKRRRKFDVDSDFVRQPVPTTPEIEAALSALPTTPSVVFRHEHACAERGCTRRAEFLSLHRTEHKRRLLCTLHAKRVLADRLPANFYDLQKVRLMALLRFEAARDDYQARLFASPNVNTYAPGCFTVNISRGPKSPLTPPPPPMTPTDATHLLRSRALSPAFLGPVEHGQPGLPVALNLQNFIVGSQMFACEVAGDDIVGDRFLLFRRQRDALYRSAAGGQRYRYGDTTERHVSELRSQRRAAAIPGVLDTTPMCFVFLNRADGGGGGGTEMRLDVLQTRAVVCSFYEHLARRTADYAQLVALHKEQRKSLLIVGEGARLINFPVTRADLERYFNDVGAPFGTEMTLLTMLRLEDETLNGVRVEPPWSVAWRRLFNDLSFAQYFSERGAGGAAAND